MQPNPHYQDALLHVCLTRNQALHVVVSLIAAGLTVDPKRSSSPMSEMRDFILEMHRIHSADLPSNLIKTLLDLASAIRRSTNDFNGLDASAANDDNYPPLELVSNDQGDLLRGES